MPRRPTNRPAKVARHQNRRERVERRTSGSFEKKPAKKPRPWLSRRKSLAVKLPLRKVRFPSLKKMLATAALFGAVAYGASGCAQLGIGPVGVEARQAANKAARETASTTLGAFVPIVGGKVGDKLGGMAVELLLGPDMMKELERIPKDKRFNYLQGLPVLNEPWFRFLALNQANPEHKPIIDVVEMVSRQTKVFPQEIVLVVGAYPKFEWEGKLFVLRKALPETNRQISMLEEDLNRIKSKYGSKKEILKELKALYVSKDRMAVEFLTLQALFNMGSDPRIDSLAKVIGNKISLEGCRNSLKALFSNN